MPCGNILVSQACSYIKHDDGTLTVNAENHSNQLVNRNIIHLIHCLKNEKKWEILTNIHHEDH